MAKDTPKAPKTAEVLQDEIVRKPTRRVDVQQKLDRIQSILEKRKPYEPVFQLLGEYFHTRRTDFTRNTDNSAKFLISDRFDTDGPQAAHTAASALVSFLWPNTAQKFRFVAPRGLEEGDEEKEYYEQITQTIIDVMTDPEAGFPVVYDEYMLENVVFGSAAIEPMPDPVTKVAFRAWGLKHLMFDLGKNDRPDTVILVECMDVYKLVEEYGLANVSKRTQDLYNAGKFDEEVEVRILIEPRAQVKRRRRRRRGKRIRRDQMPFESIHIEADQKHILREGGFTEQPLIVNMFWHVLGERLGRSPAMQALPNVLGADTLWEQVHVAIEKNLEPPIVVENDAIAGNGEINTSARGVIVVNGRSGPGEPVRTLFQPNEIRQPVNLLEMLGEKITNQFFIDKLLDFNNEAEMTLGETQLRNKLRNAALSSVFTRQIAHLSRVINRTFNILLDAGHLGVIDEPAPGQFKIPESIAQRMMDGEDVYQLEYLTPAMRVMQAEESAAIVTVWEFAAAHLEHAPEMRENLDPDVAIRMLSEKEGAPSEMLLPADEVADARVRGKEDAEMMNELDALVRGSEAMRNLGQGNPGAAGKLGGRPQGS